VDRAKCTATCEVVDRKAIPKFATKSISPEKRTTARALTSIWRGHGRLRKKGQQALRTLRQLIGTRLWESSRQPTPETAVVTVEAVALCAGPAKLNHGGERCEHILRFIDGAVFGRVVMERSQLIGARHHLLLLLHDAVDPTTGKVVNVCSTKSTLADEAWRSAMTIFMERYGSMPPKVVAHVEGSSQLGDFLLTYSWLRTSASTTEADREAAEQAATTTFAKKLIQAGYGDLCIWAYNLRDVRVGDRTLRSVPTAVRLEGWPTPGV
jgi:hypothetical protein